MSVPQVLTRSSRVLILGDDARTVLPIARSLGRRGVEIHLAWTTRSGILTSSRYVHRTHEAVLDPGDAEATLSLLNRVIEQNGIEAVFPATENATVFLCRHRDQLPQEVRFAIPNPRAAETVFDKRRTQLLAQELGIPIPATHFVDSMAALHGVLKSLKGPVVVKPLSSTSKTCTEKQFVRVFEDGEALLSPGASDLQFPILIQEHFQGEGQGIGFLARRGDMRRFTQHRRLHETTGHGSTYRETMAVDPELEAAARKLIAELEFDGVGMCEFRVDPKSGRWILMEINGRFWGSLPLATAAGVDFPWLYYLQQHDIDVEPSRTYRVGVRARMFREDLRWMWRSWTKRDQRNTGDDGWRISQISRRRLSYDLFRMLSGCDYIDSFCWTDLRPFRREVSLLASKLIQRKQRSPL